MVRTVQDSFVSPIYLPRDPHLYLMFFLYDLLMRKEIDLLAKNVKSRNGIKMTIFLYILEKIISSEKEIALKAICGIGWDGNLRTGYVLYILTWCSALYTIHSNEQKHRTKGTQDSSWPAT